VIGLGFSSLALVGEALHGWGISSSTTALTAHLLQLEQTTGDSNAVLRNYYDEISFSAYPLYMPSKIKAMKNYPSTTCGV
jgi:hypothetical protein